MAYTDEQKKLIQDKALSATPVAQLNPDEVYFRSYGKFRDEQITPDQGNTTPTPGSGIVSSSDPVVNEEKNITNTVNGLSVPSLSTQSAQAASDSYLNLIDEQQKALELRRQAQIEGINKQFEDAKVSTEDAQNRETGTTNVALQRVGGYLGTQISGVGVLNNLATTHRAEIASLEAKKAAAIQAANSAIDDKQFGFASMKAQEIKSIEADINDRRNKFFDQSLDLIKEQRAQEAEQRQQDQYLFKKSLDIVDRVAPTIVEALQGFDNEKDASAYLLAAAKDYGVDPDLLLGEANKIMAERRQEETKSVITLAQKFPDADISTSDSFDQAQAKVRNSKSYQLDIAKAEADLANTRSLISQRGAETIDFSSPILKIYTDVTGRIVDSTGDARAINGYADSLLADKEIVGDDYNGPLLDNQIRSSDAKNTLTEAFGNLKFGTKDSDGVPDSLVWQWLGTDEAIIKTDEQKKSYIMGLGKNPNDFGVY